MSHPQETGGAVIGGILGLVKSIFTVNGFITVEIVTDTMILAAVGAAVGYVVTGILKWIKSLILKLKKREQEKE